MTQSTGSQLELFWLIACLNSLATSRKIYLSKWRMQKKKKPNYNKMCLRVSCSSKLLLCTIFCLGLQVRHRWCELVVKHAYAQAYGDVEHFLIHDQVNTHSCEAFIWFNLRKIKLNKKNFVYVCSRPWVCICTGSWWFRRTLSSRLWRVTASH